MSTRPYINVTQGNTPQSEPLLGERQVENSAGGYVYKIDPWQRLDRFLILGSEGGTYYVGESKLTRDNAENVLWCIGDNGLRVVTRTVEISEAARAPSNDPALFVLALCAAAPDPKVRAVALTALPRVARTGTHLFHFMAFIQGLRGRGRGLNGALRRWYQEMPLDKLVLQLAKYKQRDGWSHRDILRLTKPCPGDIVGSDLDKGSRSAAYHWATRGSFDGMEGKALISLLDEQHALNFLQACDLLGLNGVSDKVVARAIRDFKLPREVIPSERLGSVEVWDALLEDMPTGALVRNLGKMSAVGLLKPLSAAEARVVAKLTDADAVKHSRIHPMAVLLAILTYGRGHGDKGSLTWDPCTNVLAALERCYEHSFANSEPANKRTLIAVDTSGSMYWPQHAVKGIFAAEAAAAMMVLTLRQEQQVHVTHFSSGPQRLKPMKVSARSSLTEVCEVIRELSMVAGGTDCALPMLHAAEQDLEVDTFWILTDNETWAGTVHPKVALERYRRKTGLPARLIVSALTPSEFSIADPADPLSLDTVGMDAALPQLVADFSGGRV